LTPAQFERAAALEVSHQRWQTLLRMNAGQVRSLLAGEISEAAAWIQSAADCGLTVAQITPGRLLLEGHGLERDPVKVFRWFMRAAARGNAEALNMVGRCHQNGWGIAVDFASAAAAYRRSTDAAHDWGQYNLGNLLFDGRGIPPDQRQALRLYLLAAEQGHTRAMILLGRCLEEGWGCRPDQRAARYWYRRAAEGGYFRAQFNHALALLQAGQYALASQWFVRAAHGGDGNMRRAIEAVLKRTSHPALRAALADVQALPSSGCSRIDPIATVS